MLVIGVIIVRALERTWLSPSLLFFFGFFSHAFVAPAVYGSLGAIRADNLPYVYKFSLVSFGAALVGYILGCVGRSVKIRAPYSSLAFCYKDIHPFFIRYVSVLLALFLLAYVLLFGIDQAKGVGAYETNLSLLQRVGKLTIALPALVASWYLLIQTRIWKSLSGKHMEMGLFLAVAAIVVVASMLLFAREQPISMLLFLFMIHHYRVSPFSFGQIAFFLIMFVLLQVIAQLRSFDIGISDITFSEVLDHIWVTIESGAAPMVLSILSSLPGQNVFVEVVDIVQNTEYKFGATYLQSAIGLATPSFLGLKPIWETPAHWFRNEFAPDVENHGFDFSALAEAYLNFGDYGFLVFIVFGFLIARASLAIQTGKSISLVLLGAIVVVGLTFGLRHDSYATMKGIVYSWVAVVALGKAGSLLAMVLHRAGDRVQR